MKWFRSFFVVGFLLVISACTSNTQIIPIETPQPIVTPEPTGIDPRTGNCRSIGQIWGPCYDEEENLLVANISLEKFLINGWLK